MTKKQFETFLKGQNPEATLYLKDKNNIADIKIAVTNVFSEHDDYFELYNDIDDTDPIPMKIKDILKDIKGYDSSIRVDMIAGNEDGNDTAYDISDISDFEVLQPSPYENKKFLATLEDIEPEEMDWNRLKSYAKNIFLANVGDDVMQESGLTYDDVKSENITMDTIKKLFEFMNEEFEEILSKNTKEQKKSNLKTL